MTFTIKDVKAACNSCLRDAFPGMRIYDSDTLDGYTRPSFFTEIFATNRSKESAYLTAYGFRFKITYFESTHDEAHCLDVYNRICEAFEPRIRLGDSAKTRLTVSSISYDWIDENADKLQVTIDFMGGINLGGYTETDDLMLEVDMTYESEVY